MNQQYPDDCLPKLEIDGVITVGRIFGVTVIVLAVLCKGTARAKGVTHRTFMQEDNENYSVLEHFLRAQYHSYTYIFQLEWTIINLGHYTYKYVGFGKCTLVIEAGVGKLLGVVELLLTACMDHSHQEAS